MNSETQNTETYIDDETRLYGINSVDSDTLYVHFTDRAGAVAITESRELRAGNWGSAFAVVAGGCFVPGVQHTNQGVANGRDFAVVFTAAVNPDVVFPEECKWAVGKVALTDAAIVTAAEAVELLVDPIDDDE